MLNHFRQKIFQNIESNEVLQNSIGTERKGIHFIPSGKVHSKNSVGFNKSYFLKNQKEIRAQDVLDIKKNVSINSIVQVKFDNSITSGVVFNLSESSVYVVLADKSKHCFKYNSILNVFR